MGKIKQRLVRRTGDELDEKGIEFTPKFGENKEILGNTMPSKKIRNQLAGYMARKKRHQEEVKKKLEVKKK